MPKLVIIIVFCTSFSVTLKAQPSLIAATGFSMDGNGRNTVEQFDHIPISIQWKPFSRHRGGFLVKLDYDIAVSGENTGNAYTLNPGLPSEVTLSESVRPHIFTVSIGWRIYLFSVGLNNKFYLDLLPFGITNQNFKVNYGNYDKTNYDILNPDVNYNKAALDFSMGLVYQVFLKTGEKSLMIMLHEQTPLIDGTGSYTLSYKFVAPVQLTIGYNFDYNKNR